MSVTRPASNVQPSSGNVSASLGPPNGQDLQTKFRMMYAINEIIVKSGLSREEAAKLLEVNEAKMSALRDFGLKEFSMGQLMRFAIALQHDVVIELKPRPAAKGAVRVLVVTAA